MLQEIVWLLVQLEIMNGNDLAGHVRIYEWNGTSWSQQGQDIDGEAAGDDSGYSVSMNAAGDRVAIGATGNDGNGNTQDMLEFMNGTGHLDTTRSRY